jgi:hypothetical protein
MAAPSRRPARRRRVERDDSDQRAIAAIRERFGAPGPVARLGELIAEQEAAVLPPPSELSPAARRLRANFEREGTVLTKRIAAELKVIATQSPPVFDRALPAPRDLLHVFGADVAGTGAPFFYRLAWTFIEGTSGTSIDARADVRTGKFLASHYSTSGALSAYAAIGVRFTPQIDCLLSVRPYVNWSGWDILQHRVFDSQLNEQRWASAAGALGIYVESAEPNGALRNEDANHWIDLWNRSELNPSGTRGYGGSESSATGLQAQFLASKQRRYSIWVCCRAFVSADPGFAVSTRANAALSCELPYLVVEEIPN